MDKNNFIISFYTKPAELYSVNMPNSIIFYPIQELLFLTIIAILLGAKNWHSIIENGYINLTILKNYFPFNSNIPTACVINKLFNLIDNKYFNYWLYSTIITLLKNLRANIQTVDLEIASTNYNNSYHLTIMSTNCKKLYNIINYINFSNTIVKTNIKDLKFLTKLNNKIINYNSKLDSKSDSNLGNNYFLKEGYYYLQIQLLIKKEFNQYYAANNMLKLQNIIIDIIKQYKIKVCSKRSINMLYKLLNNNNLALIDFLNKWIYGK